MQVVETAVTLPLNHSLLYLELNKHKVEIITINFELYSNKAIIYYLNVNVLQIKCHTIIERLEIANESNIFIYRWFFGVDGPSQYMTAELHMVLSC